MRTETTTRTLYKFDELSEQAKQRAIDWYRSASSGDSFWSESVIDDAKEIAKRMGIKIDDIFYSGFSSQGDGACFEGSYSFARNSVKQVKTWAPVDLEVYRIAEGLASLQKKNAHKLIATVVHRGHYYHEHCTEITVGLSDSDREPKGMDELRELLRDFMRWIYRSLEREYDYQNSDEQVTESILANEYEFTEDGNRA